MTIVFRNLDFPDKICRFELNNSKCIDTARLIYAEKITVVYGIVLWEHPRAIQFSVFQTFSRTDREHSLLLQGSALRDKSKLCDN